MKVQRIILIISLLIFILAGCSSNNQINNSSGSSDSNNFDKDANEILGIEPDKSNGTLSDLIGDSSISNDKSTNLNDNSNENTDDTETKTILSEVSEICEFRVIDCGQADSILIHLKDYNVLVDAGEEKDAAAIRKVLDNLGIKKIDILIGTHPHADHIGGMQSIVENYDIEKIIMSPQIHTSKTYENLLEAIDKKSYTVTLPNIEKVYELGKLKLKIIGPCKDYEELNDDSVVAIATFGDIDMLLTGDAEFQAEKDYVDYLDDSIEILKVGHHGSDTSTSDNLLNIIKPEVGLISCGEGNSYGHPKGETLQKLVNNNIKVYRTDLIGDIIIKTDGINYTVEDKNGTDLTNNPNPGNPGDLVNSDNSDNSDKSEDSNNDNKVDKELISDNQSNTDKSEDNIDDNSESKVYITKSGKKYHSSESCVSLYVAREIYEVTEEYAIGKGAEKCSKCW